MRHSIQLLAFRSICKHYRAQLGSIHRLTIVLTRHILPPKHLEHLRHKLRLSVQTMCNLIAVYYLELVPAFLFEQVDDRAFPAGYAACQADYTHFCAESIGYNAD